MDKRGLRMTQLGARRLETHCPFSPQMNFVEPLAKLRLKSQAHRYEDVVYI